MLALLFVAARYSRRAKLRRFGRLDVVDKMMPDASRYTPAVRIVLQCLALAIDVDVVSCAVLFEMALVKGLDHHLIPRFAQRVCRVAALEQVVAVLEEVDGLKQRFGRDHVQDLTGGDVHVAVP